MNNHNEDTKRIALVTGGNKGIGFETARRLKNGGYTIYIGVRNKERGRKAAEELNAEFLQLDVTDENAVKKAAAELEQLEGRIDVLINNAGIREPRMNIDENGFPQPFQKAADLTGTDATQVFDTNVFGIVRVIHAFLPLLEKSPHPVIVNVSSGMGSFALVTDPERGESQVNVPLYSASKAAVTMLTVQYAKLLPGMRVNAADPGLTATDFNGGSESSGQTVTEGTDAIVQLAGVDKDGPTGIFVDRFGPVEW